MRVIGIDPGFGRCGMAIVERLPVQAGGNGRDTLLYSTCVETDGKQSFAERLNEVISRCHALIREYKPDAFAIEKLYFSKNQKTAMQVAEVRGALIQCAQEECVSLSEYGPGQIKSAITSSGSADKAAMMKMIPLLIKLERPIRHDDEYDAIAVALTHLAIAR